VTVTSQSLSLTPVQLRTAAKAVVKVATGWPVKPVSNVAGGAPARDHLAQPASSRAERSDREAAAATTRDSAGLIR
jgi:hypothetical protein